VQKFVVINNKGDYHNFNEIFDLYSYTGNDNTARLLFHVQSVEYRRVESGN